MAHLTQEQRYTISVLIAKNHTQMYIAEVIGKDKATVSRELKRNCDQRNGEYRPDLAQRKYEERLSNKPKSTRFTEDIKSDIIELLEEGYSPEQICGRLKNLGNARLVMKQYTSLYGKTKRKEEIYMHSLGIKGDVIENEVLRKIQEE